MIKVHKKSILTALGPISIENIQDGPKKELEDIISITKSFFSFHDYTIIYFDDKVISIQWKDKFDSKNIEDLEKSYKDKIDSFIKKIYNPENN